MSYPTTKMKDITLIKTGKLDSNAAVDGGRYPFFTCDPNTLKINNWAYDTEAVLLAGNNARGNYTAKFYKGKFNAYQRVYIIETADPLKLNTRYLCYALNQQLQLLKTMSSGSTTKFLTLGMLHGLDIPLPSIEVQKQIVSVLSAYDDLIENNQKQIKLLEEAAQRLYKEWFVDLRFPRYEKAPIIDGVPQGWKKLPLGELIKFEIGGGWGEDQPTEKCDQPAYVIRGTDLYDVTHGNAKSIPYRYHSQSNLNSRKLQDGDIVFEVSGGSKNEGVARTALITKSLVDFLGGDVICASFCKLIRFKNKSAAKYMYDTFQYLRNSGETVKFDKRSASSIVNYRWKDFLEQQFIFVPTTDILTKFNVLAENMQKTIVNKAQTIEQAKQARDRLLSKLMSGELEV